MKNFIYHILNGIKPKRKGEISELGQAILQIYPEARYKELILSTPEEQLIEQLAVKLKLSKFDLLSEAAASLNLKCSASLQIPSVELIERTSLTEEMLKNYLALPQASNTSTSNYSLAIAAPSKINVSAFKELGIELFLSLGETINESWKLYSENSKVRENHLNGLPLVPEEDIKVLTQLVHDSKLCGAREIFLGYPERCFYQFTAENKLYSGKIGLQIFNNLSNAVDLVPQLKLSPNGDSSIVFNAAFTCRFPKPIICLTWETASSYQEPSSTLKSQQKSNFTNRYIEQIAISSELTNSSIIAQSEPTSIAVIDDDRRFAQILTRLLANQNYICRHYTDIASFMVQLRQGETSPRLIICDLHLPKVEGTALVNFLRKRGDQTPIIILSSDTDILRETELLSLGANTYLRKNEDFRVVLAWVENLLKISAHLKYPPQQEVTRNSLATSPA